MKFMVMYKLSRQGVWKERDFETEKEAFSFAHSLRVWGVVMVEIYQRGRVGYHQIG